MSVIQYHGNPNLKPFGVQIEYTPTQIQEYIKCKEDPLYFIENYCKIISLDHGLVPFKLYPYQREFILSLHNNRKIICMLSRQMGKTICVGAYIAWYVQFNPTKKVAVLANKGAAAREILSRIQLIIENIPLWLQQGVVSWNKGSIELENGSMVFTGSTTSSGIRGQSVNFLYLDEFAIIPNTVAEDFLTSTYPTISSGTTTKIAITSTPLGLNHFWKMWNDSKQGNNDFVNFFAHWSTHPNRDEVWSREQRRLLGCDIKFNQEVECSFVGSSFTLINAEAQMKMSASKPIYSKDGIDIFDLPAKGIFDFDKNEWAVKPGVYCAIVDPGEGVGQDYSVCTIIRIDILPYRIVGKYRSNAVSPLLFPNMIYKLAKEYNDAWVFVEINKTEQVPHILVHELEYENVIWVSKKAAKGQTVTGGFGGLNKSKPGVVMDRKVKRIGCDMAKTLIEEGKLYIPDADLISEISTFIRIKTSYGADEGANDDLMMTIVLFGWLTSQPYFKELSNIDLRRSIYEARIQAYESESLPVGEFWNGSETAGANESGWITVNSGAWTHYN